MKIPLLHGIIMRYAFAHQPKKDEFKDMEFAFIDSKGKKYYKYPDYFNLPLPRRKEIEKLLLKMKARINAQDLDDWTESMEDVLSRPDKKKANTIAIELLGGLKLRRSVEIEGDILFQMCACVYICEDQNPAIWDEEYENRKIDHLKKDFSESGGLRDFFLKAGLRDCIPSWIYTEEGLTQCLENTTEQIRAYREMIAEVKTVSTGSGTTGS